MKHPMFTLQNTATIFLATGSLCLFGVVGQIIAWSLDYQPPFALLEYSAKAARPGEMTVVDAKVRRELHRRCSVTFSRVFFDSVGARFELTDGVQMMNALALDAFNKISPERLLLKFPIPEGASPGPGSVMTTLDYVCNPVHQWHPIPVVFTMKVEVLQ